MLLKRFKTKQKQFEFHKHIQENDRENSLSKIHKQNALAIRYKGQEIVLNGPPGVWPTFSPSSSQIWKHICMPYKVIARARGTTVKVNWKAFLAFALS